MKGGGLTNIAADLNLHVLLIARKPAKVDVGRVIRHQSLGLQDPALNCHS